MAEDFSKADKPYFIELLSEAPKHIDSIDENISLFIDRPLEQLDPVERAVLRLATYELLYRLDIPYRVTINEAVQLTKKFGAGAGSYVCERCNWTRPRTSCVPLNAKRQASKPPVTETPHVRHRV